MAQHFLLSRQAKTLTLAQVFRMSDAEAETMLRAHPLGRYRRRAVCSHCGSLTAYECRRPSGAPRWRCKDCKQGFPITSGTLFARHKLPLRGYLARHRHLLQRGQGQAHAGALSRDLGLSYKSAFVSGAQAARGDGRGNEGPPDRRRPARGRGRWRLLRRLREARQPQGGPR